MLNTNYNNADSNIQTGLNTHKTMAAEFSNSRFGNLHYKIKH